MRRTAILLLLLAFPGCATPRNPYYPDLEETRRARREPLTASEPDGFLKMLAGLLELLAKNT
jgi:hypothetical protein